jgi:SAM-dependent methyltransferase
MDDAELRTLLTPEGLRLLDDVRDPALRREPLAAVTRLRAAGHPPELVSAVLTQASLRDRATAKFGPLAERMLFTEAGLEQATRAPVAALHAERFLRAGLRHVGDLGCGIGADALAFGSLGLEVTAVELDPVTAAVATYNLAPLPEVRVVQGRAEDADLAGLDAVYLDPARREAGHGHTRRILRPEDFSPSLDVAFAFADRLPTGIKLGPGLDRALIPRGVEAQWISVDGSVVELGVWTGPLARPGVGRAALVIAHGHAHELTAPADSEDVEQGDLGTFLWEPDGAVIRARLLGDLGRTLGAHPVGPSIAYLTGDTDATTPFATRFRVLDVLPLDEKVIRRRLRDDDVGTVEIKKRGVDIDPAVFRQRLQPKGSRSATLVLTRVGDRRRCLLVERG